MTTMKSDTFDVDLFETRLESLKDTQEGIQQMSSWCLQQRAHHKKIVASWLNVLKKVRIEHRLVMFYLANDVIQYSKRKRYEFVETWATALQRATTMVRDEKVKGKILRIFGIWEQREIFSEEYISDLHGLLNINPQKKSQATVEVTDDFQNTTLINNVRECVELSNATDLSFKKLPKAPSCDIENIKHQLKDKSHSEDVEKEIERYITYIEAYNKNLQTEIKSRKAVLSNLETAIKFYSNQRGEVKVVVSAYKNFGSRIKLVKKKLDEITPNLPSPIPSPDINAPSPERDADLQLPDEQNTISVNMFKGSFNGFSSYLDGNLPFDINDFKRDDNKPNKSSSSSTASQPIEVIATRPDGPDPNDSFNRSTEYYKPESISVYPGESDVEIPGLSPMPVPPVQSEYSSLARSVQQYGIIAAPHPPIFGGGARTYTPYSNDNSYLRNNSYNGNAGSNNASGIPLMPPPMPPTSLGGGPPVGGGSSSAGGISTIGQQNEDFNSTWDMSMSWSQLDSSNASSTETPVSPPHFERRGHNIENTAAYVEHDNSGPTQDVDHRQLHLATGIGLGAKLGLSKEKSRQLDIDHRNLISLTGSPSNNDREADKDKDFRSNKLFTSGDVDYRSGIGVVQAIPTIDTIPMPTNSSMKPPPLPPTFLGFESPNKILTQKSSSPHKSNASSSSESQREDASGGGGYDPADMVVDMDMSDEDLDDIFREVNEENEEQLELSQTSSTTAADTASTADNLAGENLAALHSNSARPPLLETPPEYVPQNNVWDQTPPFPGAHNMQEQHQLEQESWNEMSMPYGNNVGGAMYPPPPRPPFHMPQHMQQQHEYPHLHQPQPHFMGGGGDRGGFGGGPPGPRGRGRGWGHSPQNPFRNSIRPPRGGPAGGGGGLGSPYFNRGGGRGGMRGGFRGKFRGNNAWI